MLVLVGKDTSEASLRFLPMGFAAVRLRALVVSINVGPWFSRWADRVRNKVPIFWPNSAFDRSRRRFSIDPFRKGGGPVNSVVRQV